MAHKKQKNLLLDEYSLQIQPTLAVMIGLNEAIVFQKIHLWTQYSKTTEIDGEEWVYSTYEQWQKDQFPFWSIPTIQRTFISLERKGLLISKQLKSYHRKKYYRIDYDAFARMKEAFFSDDPSYQIETPSHQFDAMDDINLMSSQDINLMSSINESKRIMNESLDDANASSGENRLEGETQFTPSRAIESDAVDTEPLIDDFVFEQVPVVAGPSENPDTALPAGGKKKTALSPKSKSGDLSPKSKSGDLSPEEKQAKQALSVAFNQASGLTVRQVGFGLWWSGIKRLYEAGITPEQVAAAVKKMRDDGLTIKSPASIHAVAINLQVRASRKQVNVQTSQTYSIHGGALYV